MGKIIEARAIISAEDKTGGAFASVAKKAEQVAKVGKTVQQAMTGSMKSISDEVAKMSATLDKVGQFRALHTGLQTARQRFRETEAEVQRLGKAMSMTAEPTAKMVREYERAQRAVTQASRAFEQQRTAVGAARTELSSMGLSIDRLAASEQRLKGAIDQANASLRHQEALERQMASRAERRANRRDALRNVAAGVGIFAGHKARHGAHTVVDTYREFDKERRFARAVMGITDEEQAPLIEQAIRGGATTKFNDIQFLEAQRELAARGLKRDQILGIMDPAAQLGMALDLKLPDAVKQMEGALFGFKRDISTTAAAIESSRRIADVQTKAAKISGMTPEDITQAYKYGATPARLAGVSEETLLAFAGIGKKANMGGDEMGVAFRALMASATSPTRKGKEALLAAGLDFKNYQKNPDALLLSPFVDNIAAQYGVNLRGNAKATQGLGRIFNDKGLISDPSKFAPAVVALLKETLGGNDAKSLKSIAGAANR